VARVRVAVDVLLGGLGGPAIDEDDQALGAHDGSPDCPDAGCAAVGEIEAGSTIFVGQALEIGELLALLEVSEGSLHGCAPVTRQGAGQREKARRSRRSTPDLPGTFRGACAEPITEYR
jgi:hypothetical protein